MSTRTPTPLRLRGWTMPRFDAATEQQFRRSTRLRHRLARTLLFLVFALSFGAAPLHDAVLFGATSDVLPLLRVIELVVVMPLMLAAAAVSLFDWRRTATQAVQSAAVFVAIGATVLLRYLSLDGALNYPAQMSGVVMIAVAFFGGFRWSRIAAISAFFCIAAIGLEFWKAPPGSAPLLTAYSLFFMGAIAIAGSYSQELLTRAAWWDLNRLRTAQAALQASEQRFEAFMDHTPGIAWIKDAEQRYMYRNKAHRDRYGQPGEDWSGRRDADFFPAAAASLYSQTDQQVLSDGHAIAFESLNRSRDGEETEWWIHKFAFRDSEGRLCVGGTGVDVGERKRLEQKLRESEERFQTFLDHSPTISWMKDEQGHYLYASQSFRQFLGVADDSWRGKTDADYFPPEFAQRSREMELLALETGRADESQGTATDAHGAERHWLLLRFPFSGPGGRKFIGGVATDITARKHAEDQVRLQSLTDDLTGLYNRRGFNLLVKRQLMMARRYRHRCALLYVDLDGLKAINSAHGHDGGDRAITAVAESLRVSVRGEDIVARVGGDEFVIFAEDCADLHGLRQRLAEGVEQYNQSAALPFKLSVSIGISEFDADTEFKLEEKMAEADAEMFEAKRRRAG